MHLYVLRNPCETRFGGELREDEKDRLVRVSELDPAWDPYPKRQAGIENICGKLVKLFGPDGELYNASKAGPPLDDLHVGHKRGHDPDIEQVCFKKRSPFGAQTEVYHLRGRVTIRNSPGLPVSVSFKGVRGIQAVRELSSDMMYPRETTGVVVHMGVVGLCLGKRIQTSPNCYLENRVGYGALKCLEVASRTLETCNTVRLSVVDWGEAGLEEHLWPIANDMLITGKGSVMHRFTWKSLQWDEDAEAKVLRAAQWVAEIVESVV